MAQDWASNESRTRMALDQSREPQSLASSILSDAAGAMAGRERESESPERVDSEARIGMSHETNDWLCNLPLYNSVFLSLGISVCVSTTLVKWMEGARGNNRKNKGKKKLK